ncbi:hypothetical protein K504DRAFT_272398 [Pleomassaria siparia CBS 279.74]|uniref:Uncharacterized protein n=1 Tax=Pleomassaria siparia CBS 279.74 TaxID=1314801 RepID=A0A6G1K943_9PLEO|nr:hypothetical protein K504DRAFT_272398 [Pleomassaria siparia CBS 279.74]
MYTLHTNTYTLHRYYIHITTTPPTHYTLYEYIHTHHIRGGRTALFISFLQHHARTATIRYSICFRTNHFCHYFLIIISFTLGHSILPLSWRLARCIRRT